MAVYRRKPSQIKLGDLVSGVGKVIRIEVLPTGAYFIKGLEGTLVAVNGDMLEVTSKKSNTV